ncbi:hypothetical protein ACFQ1S_00090 [Kibdelosporangium lantanae]|uniref:Uncharacterized protein n=1 Tax=Kibdelosporangium lantanae TaxID=1497396 RepID=A0ABW3M0C7_9PSEU
MARLLATPAEDVDAWLSLLLHSKGDMTRWSPMLQLLAESFRTRSTTRRR